jgi:membrane protease YdiL (CAAX protease family)
VLALPRFYTVAQVLICYLLILVAIWTTSRVIQGVWMVAAAVGIITFTYCSGRSRRELGLCLPTRVAAVQVTIFGVAAASLMLAVTLLAGQPIPATPGWPSPVAMAEYAPWAMLQQFILQSFFFLGFESLVGGKRAVWISASLFAAAHIPNPVLTIATFFGALFFCEMFRRYRSLLPLGLVHAVLGITLALCVPTALIHHMRVGIGYLHFT